MGDIVIDLGGGTLKIGTTNMEAPIVMDNCVIKAKSVRNQVFIGDEILSCNNLSGLYIYAPFKKGYTSNWEIQKQILDYSLNKICKQNSLSLDQCNVLITEPPFNFSSIRETMDELFFEEYRVAGLVRANTSFLVDYCMHNKLKQPDDSFLSPSTCRFSLIVDSGYSFTHIVPCKDGVPMKKYIRRLNIGGKVLTNRLVDIVSYRHLDVRSEVYVMNQCKEDICYVSTQFEKDMETARPKFRLMMMWGCVVLLRAAEEKRGPENSIAVNYVLPDFVDTWRGYIQDTNASAAPGQTTDSCNAKQDETAVTARQPVTNVNDYLLRLANERFTVPEILFHPSDVGFSQMGIAEAVVFTVSQCPLGWHPYLYSNIVLVGGNVRLPGFKERLEVDVRGNIPDDFPLHVTKPDEPHLTAWQGGKKLLQSSATKKSYLVKRSEYDGAGGSYMQKFPCW